MDDSALSFTSYIIAPVAGSLVVQITVNELSVMFTILIFEGIVEDAAFFFRLRFCGVLMKKSTVRSPTNNIISRGGFREKIDDFFIIFFMDLGKKLHLNNP